MSKVSVLMSVYNTCEEFLREAIESILNQTYKDFEFLIINDGSKNNAEDVINSYDDSRIRYIKNEQNLGLIGSLNKGLELASGDYIARFDSDDKSRPERLEKQVKFMDENPQVGLLGAQYQSFPKVRVSDGFTNNKDIKEAMLINCNQFGHPTVMIRKSMLNGLKYDKNALYVEDYKLWLDMMPLCDFANLPEVLLDYRKHKGSICRNKNNTIIQNSNVQKIMFEAQEKYFSINCEKPLSLIKNLNDNKQIVVEDLLSVVDFVNEVEKETEKYVAPYRLNHIWAKWAVKKCKKNFSFYKHLFKKDLQIFFEK